MAFILSDAKNIGNDDRRKQGVSSSFKKTIFESRAQKNYFRSTLFAVSFFLASFFSKIRARSFSSIFTKTGKKLQFCQLISQLTYINA